MKRINQRGAVLGFIVVGVILVGLLAGSVYFISHQKNNTHTPQTQNPTALSPKEKPSTDTSAPTQDEDDSSKPAVTPPSATELPQTGMTETIGMVFWLGIISGALVSYVRSRRQLASL